MLTPSDSKVAMLVMAGSGEGSEAERMVAQARQAITLDTVDKALTVEAIDRVIISTNSRPLAEALRDKPVYVELDVPGEAFHFGRQLLAMVDKYEIERLFYVGGGSGPLLSAEEIGHIAKDLLSTERLLIANNFYSTDFAAFTPASILKEANPPAFDNDLGWLLGEILGLPIRELPRTAATQLDVDTPMDLMTLQLHPAAGPHVRRYLEGLDLDTSHLEEAIQFFTRREAMVLVAGRVSAATWTYLESETACQVRLFAEERGMRASGRQARGEARSLLGFHLDEVGADRFFANLSTLGQAAFIDSRVIFAHKGLWPPATDRFYSDLRRPEKIADPFVRCFTEAAMQAPIPIVLGGHSLVAGGLYALIEAAWARGKDLPRHVVPQTGL